MFTKALIKKYLLRGLLAAIVYCIPVFIFLEQQQFQSIWLLYLGNGLYLLAVTALVYFYNRQRHFKAPSVRSAISGHIVSVAGALITVVLSLLLYLLFSGGLLNGRSGEVLHQAPAAMSETATHGMLFVLIVNAALGNTISGFFAAVITSFSARRNQEDNQNA